MPVTATLVLKLREALGDEAANDLVNWVDQATAREISQFRELAELHYGRVDARLEQRLSQMDQRLSEMDQRLSEMDQRLSEMDQRLSEMDQRLSEMEQRLSQMDQRLSQMEQHFSHQLSQVKAELRADMAAQRAEMIKWMFLFWVGTIVPLAGLMIALIRL